MHAILKTWHPMLGVDFHIPWPPGSPAPAPAPVPYKTGMALFGTGLMSSYAPSHNTMGMGCTMQQGTDIGTLIAHIGAPSLTLPIEWVFSSSKSHFGVSRYKAEGKPIAVALLLVANPNLNCGTPLPTPTGVVLALNTHFVGMTLADFLGGLAFMAADFLLQAVLQKLGDRGAGFIARRLVPPVMSRTAAKAALRSRGVPGRAINAAARALRDSQRTRAASAYGRVVTRGVPVAVSGVAGGPMGADLGLAGVPTPGGYAADRARTAIQSYQNNGSVEEHTPRSHDVGPFTVWE